MIMAQRSHCVYVQDMKIDEKRGVITLNKRETTSWNRNHMLRRDVSEIATDVAHRIIEKDGTLQYQCILVYPAGGDSGLPIFTCTIRRFQPAISSAE